MDFLWMSHTLPQIHFFFSNFQPGAKWVQYFNSKWNWHHVRLLSHCTKSFSERFLWRVDTQAKSASWWKCSSFLKEQVQWAVEEGADFILGETFTLFEEALIAAKCIKQYGKGITFVILLMHFLTSFTWERSLPYHINKVWMSHHIWL